MLGVSAGSYAIAGCAGANARRRFHCIPWQRHLGIEVMLKWVQGGIFTIEVTPQAGCPKIWFTCPHLWLHIYTISLNSRYPVIVSIRPLHRFVYKIEHNPHSCNWAPILLIWLDALDYKCRIFSHIDKTIRNFR